LGKGHFSPFLPDKPGKFLPKPLGHDRIISDGSSHMWDIFVVAQATFCSVKAPGDGMEAKAKRKRRNLAALAIFAWSLGFTTGPVAASNVKDLSSYGIVVKPLKSLIADSRTSDARLPAGAKIFSHAQREYENGVRGLLVIVEKLGVAVDQGIAVGDVISAVNEEATSTMEELGKALDKGDGRKVVVRYAHQGAMYVAVLSDTPDNAVPPQSKTDLLTEKPTIELNGAANTPAVAPDARKNAPGESTDNSSPSPQVRPAASPLQSQTPRTSAAPAVESQRPEDGVPDSVVQEKFNLLGFQGQSYKRGDLMASTGGKIPRGTVLYPIRVSSRAAAVPALTMYFFQDEFAEWKCLFGKMIY